MRLTKSPTIHDIERARLIVNEHLIHTPVLRSDQIDKLLGCYVFWKAECLQRTGAFKVRGALNCIYEHVQASNLPLKGVVAASSGNHGIGISFAAMLLNIPAIIVMPERAPAIKQQTIKSNGAQVILYGDAYDDALEKAQEVANLWDWLLIPSFDDPAVIAGQATIGMELLEDLPDFDDLIVPVGGGGLAAGLGIVLETLKPQIRLYGVQVAAAPSTVLSIRVGDRVSIMPEPTIADGIVVKTPGALTFSIMQRTLHQAIAVKEQSVVEAVASIARWLKLIVEPAGAVCFSAIAENEPLFSNRKVVCVLSGGNIDLKSFCEIVCV